MNGSQGDAILIYCDRHPDRPRVAVQAFELHPDAVPYRWLVIPTRPGRRPRHGAAHVNLLNTPERARPRVYTERMADRSDLADIWPSMHPLHEFRCYLCQRTPRGDRTTVQVRQERLDGILDALHDRGVTSVTLTDLAATL